MRKYCAVVVVGLALMGGCAGPHRLSAAQAVPHDAKLVGYGIYGSIRIPADPGMYYFVDEQTGSVAYAFRQTLSVPWTLESADSSTKSNFYDALKYRFYWVPPAAGEPAPAATQP